MPEAAGETTAVVEPTVTAPVVTPADPATVTDPVVDPAADDASRPERQAARYRTERNALQSQLDAATKAQADQLAAIAKALGLAPDETADPAVQVGELSGQVETLTSTVTQLNAELLVHTLAGDVQANPVALLDSRAFTTKLHGLDPSAADYREQVANAIKEAVNANANLRSKGQGPARGGAPGAGQGPANPDGAVTQEQFDAMAYAEKVALFQTNPDLYRRLTGRTS